MTINFCVHGHFYQPPREDPLNGTIPVEDGAAPFQNWNERVFANCYLPNAQLRNFQKISFDIGPTLWRWMKTYHPTTSQKIIEQENAVFQSEGISNALAQPYNHTILPLDSYEDKVTQIRWGLADFEHTFGHKAAGMWLPETAADSETLRVMVKNGIEFTILAPWQANTLDDPNLPAKIKTSNGEITVFFYQQEMSSRVSFDPSATENADSFAQECRNKVLGQRSHNPLMVIASDGELYGHHQPFRDLFLDHLLVRSAAEDGMQVTFPGKWLKNNHVVHSAHLCEKTSWSCMHGIERWHGACGCTPNGEWKRFMRSAMDQLGDLLNEIYFHEVYQYADPWELRHEYIHIINQELTLRNLLKKRFSLNLDETLINRLDILLAAQYERQRMFTSCGWFFDDFDRIEPKNNIRYAAQAVWLTSLATGFDLSADATRLFHQVRSWRNGSKGDDIFFEHVNKAERMANIVRR